MLKMKKIIKNESKNEESITLNNIDVKVSDERKNEELNLKKNKPENKEIDADQIENKDKTILTD